MWYEVPKEAPASRAEKPKLIFPWETNQSRPSRVFIDDLSRAEENESGTSSTPTGELDASSDKQPSAETSFTEHSTVGQDREPMTPATPTIHITPVDPWTSYTRTNAWDEDPKIERYVEGLQKTRRSRSIKSPGVIEMPGHGGAVDASTWERRGSKLTDFPSEAERPSLPVTPAPIRRPKFWGGGGPGIGDGDDDDPLLPAAEGVPGQSEWVCVHGRIWKPTDCLCDLTNVLRYHKDPAEQLKKLAKQQSEVLLQMLGGGGGGGGSRDSSDLPARPVPFGSEELTSPTYVAQSAKLLSPQPVKGGTSSVILSDREAIPRSSTSPGATSSAAQIAEPSYTGPGATFEKGEDYLQQETPYPGTEEERDVLDT
jgi:glycogenin glucosyltransferase